MTEKIFCVEQLIAGSYVKYRNLSQLIASSYAGSACEEINLFIDLNSVLKQLYSGDVWTHRSVDQFDIAASTINMCAHYRNFFRNINVETNIFLIYGLNCPSANSVYVSGYNAKFVEAYIKKPDITKAIETNLDILNLISQYLPRIYFFNIGTCEVSSMVDYLIHNLPRTNSNIENIIISKDPLMLQLIPEHNVRIIRPLKRKDGDDSFIIDNSNLWIKFITEFRKGKIPQNLISNIFFQNILCMTSVPERSMFSVFNISKAFQYIEKSVKSNFLDPNKFYTQSGINTALSALQIKFNPTELEMRFKAINAHYQAMFILPMEKPELKTLRLIDLEDIPSLKSIVTKYFEKNPIDLDRL